MQEKRPSFTSTVVERSQHNLLVVKRKIRSENISDASKDDRMHVTRK